MGVVAGLWCRFMRRLGSFLRMVVVLAGCLVCSTMCVYTLPGEDVFAKTTWESDEVPLGPMDVERLTIAFDGDGEVMLTVDEMRIRGHYDYNDNDATAILSQARIKVDGLAVTFIEADFSNENLVFLLWRVEDILYPFTTPLHRIK